MLLKIFITLFFLFIFASCATVAPGIKTYKKYVIIGTDTVITFHKHIYMDID